jgi:hypothetical protein
MIRFADLRSLLRSDCVTSCENYLEMWLKTPCLFGKLDAAQPWHDYICEQHVDVLLSEDSQGSVTVLGRQDMEPLQGQQFHKGISDEDIVFDIQDGECLCHAWHEPRAPNVSKPPHGVVKW